MLIEFSVENFRSIKEKQTLSMLSAGKVNEHPDNVAEWGNLKLTKSAIIYGRNASGKSNLLRALNALKIIISSSSDRKLGENILYYEPYKLDPDFINKSTQFKIDYIARDNIRYTYEVSFTQREIDFETLYYYPKKQRAKLFVREKAKPIDFGVSLKGDRKGVEKQLLANQLYLSKGANSNIEQLSEPYLYFTTFLNEDPLLSELPVDMIAIFLNNEKWQSYRNNINNLLRIADTGISSLQLDELPSEIISQYKELPDIVKQKLVWGGKYKISTIHKTKSNGKEVKEIIFDLIDESTGTIKLLVVGGNIILALEFGLPIVIDELDKSLHPLLTRTLIKLFHNPKTNPKNAQLIFATHDISLLDNELFRRDQIWFTEKESDGATKVYSLSDFNGVRKDIPYDKWYMSGRFGAIPSINESELSLEF